MSDIPGMNKQLEKYSTLLSLLLIWKAIPYSENICFSYWNGANISFAHNMLLFWQNGAFSTVSCIFYARYLSRSQNLVNLRQWRNILCCSFICLKITENCFFLLRKNIVIKEMETIIICVYMNKCWIIVCYQPIHGESFIRAKILYWHQIKPLFFFSYLKIRPYKKEIGR